MRYECLRLRPQLNKTGHLCIHQMFIVQMIRQWLISTSSNCLVVFGDSIRDDGSGGTTHRGGQQTIIQTNRGAIAIQTHTGGQSLDAAGKSCAFCWSMILVNVVAYLEQGWCRKI